MSDKLPRPLKQVLRDTTPDEATIERMWSEVRRAPVRRRRVAWGLAMTSAAAAAAVVAVVLLGRGARPLALDGGGALSAVEQPAGAAAREVALDDGSRLVVAAGARIEPLENSPGRFDVALRRGRVDFRVAAPERRRWVVEAGRVTIEVFARQFSVYREEGAVEVSVLDGAVVVRGDEVPGQAQRLSAGESLRVPGIPAAPATPEAKPATEPPAIAAATEEAHEPVVEAPAPERKSRRARTTPVAETAVAKEEGAAEPTTAGEPSWRALAEQQRYGEAWERAGATDGVRAAAASQRASADELLALADLARLSGHPAEAAPLLERVVEAHPRDARAAIAAFTLGRIAFDDLHQPARAATAFARALDAGGLPRGLEEDAFARLVEALLRAGDRAAAEAAAQRYRAQFPEGRHRARVERWLAAP